MTNTLEQIKSMIVVGLMIIVGQAIALQIAGKDQVAITDVIVGMLVIIVVCMVSLKIKEALPNLKFPAFAWATLLGLILSMPFMPTAEWFLEQANHIGFLATTTPILAFAGISVGNKVEQLKKISWKLVIISIVVFCGTYFGSAIVAQVILKMQGLI